MREPIDFGVGARPGFEGVAVEAVDSNYAAGK
jgi:hypothetical protein